MSALAQPPSPSPSEPVKDRVARLQAEHRLSYQIPTLLEAEALVGLRGKRVLEVGGSLPAGLVLDELGAAQWIGIEEMSYWDEFPTGTQLTRPIDRSNMKLTEVTDASVLPRHGVLLGGVEHLPPSLHGQFDVVFSVAAFEHLLALPLALDRMFEALRPGGRVFSKFSPIWSAHDGHHLPSLLDASGRTFNFHSSPIPPWGHLLLRPPQLLQHLRAHTDFDTAAKIVYYVYNSPRINRLFTEDYLMYLDASRFKLDVVNGTYAKQVPATVAADLGRLHPGRKLFANNGLVLALTRPG
jgi:SAM-dependent methyltransferase